MDKIICISLKGVNGRQERKKSLEEWEWKLNESWIDKKLRRNVRIPQDGGGEKGSLNCG